MTVMRKVTHPPPAGFVSDSSFSFFLFLFSFIFVFSWTFGWVFDFGLAVVGLVWPRFNTKLWQIYVTTHADTELLHRGAKRYERVTRGARALPWDVQGEGARPRSPPAAQRTHNSGFL